MSRQNRPLLVKLEEASSIRMADLLNRVYKIHLECGGDTNPLLEEAKDKIKDKNNIKKLDLFEQYKAHIGSTVVKCKQVKKF